MGCVPELEITPEPTEAERAAIAAALAAEAPEPDAIFKEEPTDSE
jgi:hypothetical protein